MNAKIYRLSVVDDPSHVPSPSVLSVGLSEGASRSSGRRQKSAAPASKTGRNRRTIKELNPARVEICVRFFLLFIRSSKKYFPDVRIDCFDVS